MTPISVPVRRRILQLYERELLTTGNVVTGQMLCPDQVLERSEFYNDFLRPIDNFHEICGVISNDRSVCLSFVAKEAKVLVFIADTEIPVKSHRHVLAQVYGLTAAEERLASSLIQGKNLSQVAQEFRVTRNTLHSQLQSIFDKTGTNRQSELMRIFLKGLAQLGD